MKLTIDPKLLAELIGWTARAIPLRPPVPILAGLLLEADNDQLTVSAFDYDTSARGHAPADVTEPGRCVLPGRLLAEVAKNLPTTSFVQFTAGDRDATLTCGRAEYTLPTMPLNDYPSLPEPPAPVGTIPADAFAHAVAQTQPATSSDDTLPMLTGIRIDSDGGQLTLAATDRYRIAVTDLSWAPGGEASIGAVLPGRQLHDIARNLGHGDLTLAIDDKLAAISTPDRQTTIRLLDDQFIDYRARTKNTQPIVATVDAATLAAAVKRVALVADRKSSAIRLHFSGGEVLVRAGDADTGRGSEAADCKLDGDDIEIAFQAQYLLDVLGAIDGTARIGMEASVKPALFSSEDQSFQCVVMSLRTA